MKILRSLAVVALVSSTACQTSDPAPASSAAPGPAKSSSASPKVTASAAASAAAAPTMTREVADQNAREVLGAWLRAQNEDKFEDYSKVYDPSFAGIRRTPSGAEKKLTLEEWLADRKTMFGKAQRVAADPIQIETWHTRKLPEGEVEISFTQRWQSGAAADHGPKTMRLRADKDGAMKIVAEEMVSSSKGWEDDPKTKTKEIDGTAWKSPVKVSLVSQKGLWGHLWVVRLTDADGKVTTVPMTDTECVGEPEKAKAVNKDSALFEVDQPNCSGEHKQKVRILTDGAGIAVKGFFTADLHTEGATHWESGWLDLVRVKLAPGAKTVAE